MTKFKVTYRREKVAGSIQFDPRIEFTKVLEIRASSPEEASLQIARNEPYLTIARVEMLGLEVREEGRIQSTVAIEGASEIADSLSGEIREFIRKNPDLPPETKAILTKSQQDTSRIKTDLDELSVSIRQARTWKNRAVDWLLGGLVGVGVSLSIQIFLSLFTFHWPP
jgi:hypothetical protein